jgi:hypothetical protein
VNVAIKPPAVPYAVLRRLGQPGFVGEDLEPLLAPAYEAVSQKALEAALGESQETPEEKV